MADDTRHSRAGSPFGACDTEVRAMVDEGTRDALAALAHASEQTVSEYLRNLINGHVHGYSAVLRATYAAARGSVGTASSQRQDRENPR